MTYTPSGSRTIPETWSYQAGPHTLQGRWLEAADLPAVIGLHRRVLATLPPGILNAETDGFFADHMSGMGRMLGVETDDRELVAYAVLGLPSASAEYNFGREINIPLAELGSVAHLDGVAVAAAWRGHGLQRALSQQRTAFAVVAGRRHMTTTVAPSNLHSLRNLTSFGFTVVATRPMFAAGHMRHLLHLDVTKSSAAAGQSKADKLARPAVVNVYGSPSLSGDAA